MTKFWICTGKELIGPITERKTAEELADGNSVVAIDNDVEGVTAVPLKAKKVAIKRGK